MSPVSGRIPMSRKRSHIRRMSKGHPARHVLLPQVLLEGAGVVTAIRDRAAQDFGPDGGDVRTGQRLGTDEIDPVEGERCAGPLAADEFEGGDLADIGRIDHREALGPIGIG